MISLSILFTYYTYRPGLLDIHIKSIELKTEKMRFIYIYMYIIY